MTLKKLQLQSIKHETTIKKIQKIIIRYNL